MKKLIKSFTGFFIKKKNLSSNIIFHISMIAICLVMAYPFFWAVISSFKTTGQLYGESPFNLIPDPLTFSNYERLMEVLPFGRFLLNSLVLSIVVPVSMISIASLAAYALTRIEFPGRNLLFVLFIATMMLPSHVTLIPDYKIIVDSKLVNTYWAILLHSMFTAANAFNIFFFRQYFLSIPKDLENAAFVDGCSRIGIFFRIILPNAKPAIATTAILSFRSIWNSFLWPMIVLNDYESLTLTVGLSYLKDWEPNWGVILSGASLSIVPIIIVFIVFQKYFMASTINSGFGGK